MIEDAGSANEIELCAALVAMDAVADAGYSKVCFEGDTLDVVSWLRGEGGLINLNSAKAEEAMVLLANWSRDSICHVFWGANSVAHELAGIARSREESYSWSVAIPLSISEYLLRDDSAFAV